MMPQTTPANGADRPTVVHLLESDGVYGAEQVVLNICLDPAMRAKYRCVIACLQSDAAKSGPLVATALAQDVEAIALPIRKHRLPFDLLRATQRLRQLQPLLIHTHNYKATALAAMMRFFSSQPIVTTCHLLYAEPRSSVSVRAMLWLEERMYRRLPIVFTVSGRLRQELIARGVSTSRLRTIPNGINPQISGLNEPTDRNRLRQSLGASPDTFVVINVARLSEQKNQFAIIEAARLMRDTHPHVRFWIAGDGPMRDTLREHIASYGLEDRVLLLGFRQDVSALLAGADAFLLTSIEEGLPMSLLEAMAARIPIATTAVGGIPEAVSDGYSAVMIDSSNARELSDQLALIVDSPAFRTRLAEAAHAEYVSRFSATSMARAYRTAYAEVIQA